MANYAGLPGVSTSFVQKKRLSTWVFLWARDREAYFSRPITLLAFGIEEGDYVTISFSALDTGVVIAVGIWSSHLGEGLALIEPAINVITNGVRRFIPIDRNSVGLERLCGLLTAGRTQIENQDKQNSG
jgi:hypothetical protein